MTRLTFGGKNTHPEWSPDGERIAFQSDREGDPAIWWQRANGTGTAERLTKAERGVAHIPESWALDGKRLLFSRAKGDEVSLWVLSLPEGKTEAFSPHAHSTRPMNAVFSPDGRWSPTAATIGTDAVYVEPFRHQHSIDLRGAMSAITRSGHATGSSCFTFQGLAGSSWST